VLVHGLLDVLFVQLLREIVARRGGAGRGWSQAVHDPAVRRAVALLQADVARPWTLDLLAHEAGLSRTTLAEKFRAAMGDTPLAHLRVLRLQKAMQLLGEPRRKLDEVAQAVGYQDAFGFSKAFKRAVGLSPGEFRRRDAAERTSPWRWGGSATGT
jgi:transcriptional regulator GlxA family with amidase domain